MDVVADMDVGVYVDIDLEVRGGNVKVHADVEDVDGDDGVGV